MKRSQRWLYTFSMTTFLLLAGVMLFNYRVDSMGLFSNKSYLLQAAKTLLDGHMIAGLHDYNERLFQELLIKNMKKPVDCITLGSSRSMMIRKRFFLDENTSYFNHAVPGASLEDYMAIIGIYQAEKKALPKKVLLGIDPWIFNINNSQNRWKEIGAYYQFTLNEIHSQQASSFANNDKWKQLINYEYTYANINYLQHVKERNGSSFYTVDSLDVDDAIKESDGSTHYPFATRYASEQTVEQAAIAFTQGDVYSLENFSTLSNTETFEAFIDYLQEKQIEVILFLPPYHPKTYDILIENPQYRIIQQAEAYLNTLAMKKDLSLLGSYNPHNYGFTKRDFSDGMHGRESVAKKILEKYKRGQAFY